MKNVIVGSVLLLGVFLSAVSCKKKDDPQPANTNSTNTNTNTNTTATVYNGGSTNTYFPSTIGSTWTYAGAKNYTTTMKGDTVVGGIHYANLQNSSAPSDKGFMRIDGSNYYVGSFNPTLIANMLNLKDAPLNTTWNNDYPNLILGYDYRYTMTIDSIGASKVVHSVTYNDIIKVKQEIYIDLNDGDGYDIYETDYYYYAKNVGFIQAVLESSGTIYLSSYHIN